MVERINKDVFIANILECFTLLQTYDECYKEILDIIDVINGLNESDLTIDNLKNLIEGSEYISFDDNEAGTKLVISLDRTHLDNTPTANSEHLVTSGGVQKSIANIRSALENKIDTKTQGMLKIPITIPTEPLLVMIDTNNTQTNVPLGDGLAYQNGHLVATGGSGGVTQSYVDTQDQAILKQAKDYTDEVVTPLDAKITKLDTKKLNKYNPDGSTASQRFAYTTSYNTGDVPLALDMAPAERVSIPLRNSKGYMLTMPMTDAMMSSEGYDQFVTSFDTLKKYTQYHYAGLNTTNVFSKHQQFLAPNRYSTSGQKLGEVFEVYGNYNYGTLETAIFLGYVTQHDVTNNVDIKSTYILSCNSRSDTPVKYFILTDHEVGKGLKWNSNKYTVDISHPVVKCTQAEYDGLTKDADTLYVIVG